MGFRVSIDGSGPLNLAKLSIIPSESADTYRPVKVYMVSAG